MNKFIIDGFNMAYRAHFAFRTLMTDTGIPSGCVYGFLTMLRSLKNKYPDFSFEIAWDNQAKRKKELYPEYKANRNHANITVQIKDLKDILKCIKITQVEALEEEADDVMATIAQNNDGLVYIYSSDKDLLQLVTDGKIIVIKPSVAGYPEKVFDEEAVYVEYGVKPADFACYLAFKGDDVDNITGVERLPSKVIASLSFDYHTPVEVYNNLGFRKLTAFQANGLNTSKDRVILNYDLVKLRTNLECIFSSGSPNVSDFQKILGKYEIKAISATSYVDLFEKDTAFQKRSNTFQKVKSFNLFEGMD